MVGHAAEAIQEYTAHHPVEETNNSDQQHNDEEGGPRRDMTASTPGVWSDKHGPDWTEKRPPHGQWKGDAGEPPEVTSNDPSS